MQQERDIWNKMILNSGIIWEENCPFCKLEKDEKQLLIFESTYWEIRYNKYPYEWVQKHIIVLPKRHIEFTKDFNNNELIDLKKIYSFLYNFYEWEEYFSFIRETFKGRSIKHIHYHYMQWNIHSNEFSAILNKK
jgi:diadenosine tetraphosphate (Ap4A) HIT family hydrolase